MWGGKLSHERLWREGRLNRHRRKATKTRALQSETVVLQVMKHVSLNLSFEPCFAWFVVAVVVVSIVSLVVEY